MDRWREGQREMVSVNNRPLCGQHGSSSVVPRALDIAQKLSGIRRTGDSKHNTELSMSIRRPIVGKAQVAPAAAFFFSSKKKTGAMVPLGTKMRKSEISSRLLQGFA